MVVSKDEHPRETTLEQLARLPTPFRANGSGDGGQRLRSERRSVRVDHRDRAGGEAFSVSRQRRASSRRRRRASSRASWASARSRPYTRCCSGRDFELSQIDAIELNEAFASQGLAVLRGLSIPDDSANVNPNGGAISLGHPLGMSGARLVTTATYHLEASRGRYGLCTMCRGRAGRRDSDRTASRRSTPRANGRGFRS